MAHLKQGAKLSGNIASRFLLDADDRIGHLGHVIIYRNEDKAAWDQLNDLTMDVLPGFDVAEQIDASDGDKGAAKSFDDKMTNAQRVRDYLHVVNYLKEKVKVSEGGGKYAAAKYKKAFECKTMQQLKDVIEQLPPKIKLRFSNMDPATFFPCASTNGAGKYARK